MVVYILFSNFQKNENFKNLHNNTVVGFWAVVSILWGLQRWFIVQMIGIGELDKISYK